MTYGLGVKVLVTHNIKKDFDKVGVSVIKRIKKNLYTAAAFILRESQQLVPVDTGTLKGSGRIVVEEDGLVAMVAYTTEYAIWVHEILEYWHDPPTQAKYLEQPVNENYDLIMSMIAGRGAPE